MPTTPNFEPVYSKWRHGGWYVDNVRYPGGACGCVSNRYEDGKWRIVCDRRDFDSQPTFPTRDAAARAEYELAQAEVTALAEQAAPATGVVEATDSSSERDGVVEDDDVTATDAPSA